MAQRSAQTHAKRARELAVKEKRELKRAKKAQRAAAAEATSIDAPFAPETADPAVTRSDPKGDEHGSG
jgi:hypothetical protein